MQPTPQPSSSTSIFINAIHVGHSTGGGEATHYVARHGTGRVAKLVLIGAVPPIMVKTPANPGGLPIEVFDGLRRSARGNRSQFYHRPRQRPVLRLQSPGRPGLAGDRPELVATGHGRRGQAPLRRYQGIFGNGLTEDLKSIEVPTFGHARRR